MSIRDYNKVYHLKNMTTGELFCSIDDTEFGGTNDYYIDEVSVRLPVGDVKILNAIHECLIENHGCLISVGYKG